MKDVVNRYRVRIEGWPLADVPFKNLSDVHGGMSMLTHLEHLWGSGDLKFVPVTEGERLAASIDPNRLAPASNCARRKRPGGREDIGRARYRYKTNPNNLPLRRPKNGPKTPKDVPAHWDN